MKKCNRQEEEDHPIFELVRHRPPKCFQGYGQEIILIAHRVVALDKDSAEIACKERLRAAPPTPARMDLAATALRPVTVGRSPQPLGVKRF
jgi:hypothetical protein